MYYVKKGFVLDVLCVVKIEKIRGDDNETDLKKRGVTEIKTTVLHSRAVLSLCI